MKLNRKGYLTVEIILASTIAFAIAFFLIEITVKLVSKTDDILLGKATQTDNATKFKDVTINYKTKNGFTHYVPIFSLTSGITKVRIYMWVEGQDVDCENNASGGNIDFDLQITTELPAGASTTE